MAKRPQLPAPDPGTAIQPASAPAVDIYQVRRARGFISNLIAVLLQPGLFFRTFPTNTQWVIVAFLILFVVAVQAVRQPDPNAAEPSAGDFFPVGDPSTSDGNGGGIISGGGGVIIAPPGGFGQAPTDSGTGEGQAPSSEEVRSTTTTALLSAGGILLAWILQTLVLSLAPLLRGRPASLGRNFQVAVWASVPIGLMILIRLIYYESGGSPESPGLSALIDSWSDFSALSPFVQNFVYMLLSSLTLFWLWNIILLYMGARFALNGRVWSAFIVTLMWVIIALIVPVATGNVTAPVEAEEAAPIDGGVLMPDGMLSPDGSMPQLDGGFVTAPDSTAEPFSDATLEASSDIIILPTEEVTPEITGEPAGA